MEKICNLKFDPTFAKVAKTFLALNDETESDSGVDYKPLYLCCFNGITDILNSLYKKLDKNDINALVSAREMAIYKLQELQKKTEDLFIEQPR